MTVTAASRIAHCTGCGASFGAPPPINGLPVVLAQCGSCDRRYYISALAQPSMKIALGDEAECGFSPHLHLSAQQKTNIQELLASLPSLPHDDDDRRQHARVLAPIPLVVAPLDREFHPVAPALNAASIDISISGISFVVKSECDAPYWMVEFGSSAPNGTQAVMKIARTEPNQAGYWKVAGPFVTELDLTPSTDVTP